MRKILEVVLPRSIVGTIKEIQNYRYSTKDGTLTKAVIDEGFLFLTLPNAQDFAVPLTNITAVILEEEAVASLVVASPAKLNKEALRTIEPREVEEEHNKKASHSKASKK